MRRVGLAICVLVMSVSAARAEVKLAALFCDHAVLQAGMEAPVWGWADAGQTIEVRLGEQAATGKADAQGKWIARLAAMKATASPMQMTVSAGDEKITISDILVGEVWIGSGQSNMAMPIKQAADAERFVKEANQPQIRLFTVPRLSAQRPVDDVKGKWVVCSPQTVPTFSAVLYHFGRNLHEKLNVPVGLIHSSWGGTPIQSWMPREAFAGGDDQIAAERKRLLERFASTTLPATNPKARSSEHLEPTRLFNGMIAPLAPYAMRGVVWYQGENNVHQGDISDYATMMAAMVKTWRSQWGQGDWPLLFVQLAPFGKYKAPPESLPEMWEQQSKALKLIPSTGMAATGDLGDAGNIHPKNKHEVGRRLALMALARTYRVQGIECDAPMFASATRDGNKVRVRFSGAAGGMATSDAKPPSGFEIAGAGGKFVPAQARIDGGETLVFSDQVTEPKFVRFCWSSTPTINLTNRAGLLAVPFRTDLP